MKHYRPILRGKNRYDWWRAHHGLPNHPKWRSVAHAAGVPVSVVFHIVICLLDHASRANPRGTIADFKVFDCAGVVDTVASDVERVLEILRHVKWIEGNTIAEWDSRQPQREDQTAAERQAAKRAREASEKDEFDQHLDAPSRIVTHGKRDKPKPVTKSRNVTPVERDSEQRHATEALQAAVSGDVTKVSAPDKDIKSTTSFFPDAAREDEEFEFLPAGSLATAPLDGALTRQPDGGVGAPPEPVAGDVPPRLKRPADLSRAELEQIFEQRRKTG